MIVLEYLIFNNKNRNLCLDKKSFEYFLQTDSNIIIKNNHLVYKKDFKVDYHLEVDKIFDTEEMYFHLRFSTDNITNIEKISELNKDIRTRLHIITDYPQTLFDGISQYYSCQSYPIIYEIENLMRKLLTKFMLINVGTKWHDTSVPDDVSVSIKNKDTITSEESTYLYNVDFIQLKNFLFSEKYIANRDKLIKTIKQASENNEVDLKKIKDLIPTSNWEKYFSKTIQIKEKELKDNWEKLYNLRCKVAHNRRFHKADYDELNNLVKKIKPVLEEAISSLQTININSSEKIRIEEQIVGNFNTELGNFISSWNKLENTLRELYSDHKENTLKDENILLRKIIQYLKNNNIIDYYKFSKLIQLSNIRNEIVHFSKKYSAEEISEITTITDAINKELKPQ